ncbi:hypothetical protein N7466_008421 [Penicillium verhagenii]|uniref:uncharacterized protein n=1 Tax=Penicillium verhagenii TaxID=1562060 RepID=UPI0025455F78|nr:uncharacterized protein N7466_008421 [Penicillium verhagenii]KAJ5924234.1 hypothetical protein N7466_008421 [Penicillium verhagenii]
MPLRKVCSDALRIDLAAPEGWTFAPGDTVIGDVVRCAPIVTADANVNLFLRGRIQTSRSSVGNSGSFSTDPAIATSQPVASEQILLAKRYPIFQGPLHIPDGGNPISWSFTTEIIPDPPRRVYGKFDVSYEYLPGTTGSVGRNGMATSTAWIDYYLEAELRYLEKGTFGQNDIERTCTALYPITLRHQPLNEFEEFGITEHIFKRKVRSHRLLPDAPLSPLTMKQRAQKRFGSSKVPELSFQVGVYTPSTIQLDNPAVLPLNLIIAQGDDTSEEIKKVPRKVWIHSISLSQETCIFVKYHGASLEAGYSQPTNNARSIPTKSVGSQGSIQNLNLKDAVRRMDDFPWEVTIGDGTVDLGSVLQMVLHSDGLSVAGRRLQKVQPITPSLDVYNIRIMNWLKVELSVTVEEETFILSARAPVTILAAE